MDRAALHRAPTPSPFPGEATANPRLLLDAPATARYSEGAVTGPNPSLILASASPRRQALLESAGIAFETIPAQIAEEARPGEQPAQLVRRLAHDKAQAVAAQLAPDDPRWILGSDTVVVLAGRILGKPRDPEHAVTLLQSLGGRTHRVLTGVAVLEPARGRSHVTHVESRVAMGSADEACIRRYVAGGEPLDKAGAYALQGEGRRFVKDVAGSRSNVIGLPLDETLALLQAAGLPMPS